MGIKKLKEPDLDICDITGRNKAFPTNLVSNAEVESAVIEIKNTLADLREEERTQQSSSYNAVQSHDARDLSSVLQRRSQEQSLKQWRNEHNFSYRLEVSPGSIRVSRKLANPDMEKSRGKTPNYQSKSKIKEWSPKSRANMVARFSTLDYAPLFTNELQRPAMITLTYPDKWEEVAPTGQHAKRHLLSLKKRYQRKYGTPLYGLWKTEFQTRGAVHFHLLCSPPNTPVFRRWLAKNWAEIVNHPEPEEKARHQVSGTHVSYDDKYGGFNSRSISVYFSKHASPNAGSKEYQNQPPQLWRDVASIGRFWGYFGLKPAVWKVAISFREAVTISRTLRRFSQRSLSSQQKPMRTKVVYRHIYKNNITQTTGLLRKRSVKVSVRRFPLILGFITVSNGARITRNLSRVLVLDRSGRC